MDNSFKINDCALVILAAGASSRLGTPKQLLLYNGKSFLQNMVTAAIGTNLQPVIVVLGAHATLLTGEIKGNKVHTIHNEHWEEGIASSIRCGIEAVEKINPACDGVILMVCDQPFITAALLNQLLTTQQETGKPIVAAHYNDIAGTPVLFHKIFFPELLLLKADKGARMILQDQKDQVATVSFPEGSIDIDTMDNYQNLGQHG